MCFSKMATVRPYSSLKSLAAAAACCLQRTMDSKTRGALELVAHGLEHPGAERRIRCRWASCLRLATKSCSLALRSMPVRKLSLALAGIASSQAGAGSLLHVRSRLAMPINAGAPYPCGSLPWRPASNGGAELDRGRGRVLAGGRWMKTAASSVCSTVSLRRGRCTAAYRLLVPSISPTWWPTCASFICSSSPPQKGNFTEAYLRGRRSR
mmetsp:Transcript_32816/g.74700  ORF Transcript_32816/g.74700 Transcript_32816/m.74700 type:complete len:210 (-) Transcript_32816:30-659(-)